MNRKLTIRDYQSADAAVLRQLFFETIHHVNCRDYSTKQCQAWAPVTYDKTKWATRLANNQPFIAEIEQVIVGFADLQADGYIDHFFCHHAYQGQGIARTLMEHIHRHAKQRSLDKLYANVSITARPFFEHMGFHVAKAQQVRINDVRLTNYLMQKGLMTTN